jgi:hypothetical protein
LGEEQKSDFEDMRNAVGPEGTIEADSAIAADKFSTGIVVGTSPRANCQAAQAVQSEIDKLAAQQAKTGT